jgi:sulfate transport system permease protein
MPPSLARARSASPLPGLGLTLGLTVAYLSALVLIPLALLFAKALALGPRELAGLLLSPRVGAAFRLSLGASLAAATLNAVLGFLVAWVLVRYDFPGRRFVDGLIDLPFALPTAVAGIALTSIYSPTGWLGRPLAALGVPVAFTPLGVVVALTFISLPFVVRTVQPVLQEMSLEDEEAAACLGASRFETFVRVILPTVLPSVITGFGLALARAMGEYGSVVFISGNQPMKTEIAPLLIMTRLEQFDVPAAAALAVAMLLASFGALLLTQAVQWWGRRNGAWV